MPLMPEQFHTLYDCVAQPVLLVQDGLIVQCNRHAQSVITPGTPLASCLPPEVSLPNPLPDKPSSFQLLFGGKRVQASAQPFDGAHVVFLSAEEPPALAELSHAAQAVSAPLTTLLSASDTLLPLFSNMEDTDIRKHLSALNRSCYQLLRACETLREFTLARRGKLFLSLERIDLTDFLRSLCQRSGELCRQAGRELELTLPQTPVFVSADARMLRQVVLLLLSNAIKFTPADSRIYLSLSRLNGRAVIRLTDKGFGMEADVLSSAFSRFTRPEKPEDPRLGAGFSLPLAQAIMQAHGGSILLQSQQDAGTDVLLSLPLNSAGQQILLRSPCIHVDRSGGFLPELVALSDVLPLEAFDIRNFL